MRATLGVALRRHGLRVAALAAILAPAVAGSQPAYYDLFPSPLRNGRSIEGLVDLDEVPAVSHLADGRVIASWVTYDAKQDSTFESIPDLVEFGDGTVVGVSTVQWHVKDAADKQHEVPVVGKAALKEAYVEVFDDAGNSLGISQALSEKFGWKGTLAEAEGTTATAFKYSYASSPKGVRESGVLGVRHGAVHNGRSIITIDDTTRTVALFRGVDPVTKPKLGQFVGGAVFETSMPQTAKTGQTLAGGSFAFAVKPAPGDPNLGAYKATAKLGTRAYGAAGFVDIEGIDLATLANPDVLFDDMDYVFIAAYRFRSPAAQESYRATFQ